MLHTERDLSLCVPRVRDGWVAREPVSIPLSRLSL